MNWLNNLFSNSEGETPWWGIVLSILILIAIAAAIAAIIILIAKAVRKKTGNKEIASSQWKTRELIFGALCISVSFVLSFIQFVAMPQGGSITPASMLPIMIFAYVYGTPKGLIVGLAYGLLQLTQGAYIVHWIQFILDYMMAFMALSLTGLFKRNILPGIIVAGLGRFVVAFISGFVFWGSNAPTGQSAIIYSLIYNITYIGPDTAICFAVALIPGIRKVIESFKSQAEISRHGKQAA